jgi:hypothetical protein
VTLLVAADRVQETALSIGATSPITLLGAADVGLQRFPASLDGQVVPYAIEHETTGQWEVGSGVYTASSKTLARTTVYSNSLGTTALVNFAAGIVNVWVDAPSEKVPLFDATSDHLTLPAGLSITGALDGVTTLGVTGDFSVATSKFTVAASTGNTVVAGTVQMSHYGAGAATFDASGNITSVSDERHKTDLRPFTRGLESLRGLRPITYKYNALSGMEQVYDYSGFSAQNVQQHIPEAVFERADGILSFSDRPVLAACVNAIQSLDERLSRLEAKAA